MKKIAVLGSTGSIGTQTLDVIRNHGEYKVTALSAAGNVERMEEQIREFHPETVCMWKPEAAAELKVRVSDLDVKVLSGMEGLMEIAAETPADIVEVSVMGMVGLQPTIAAIKAGRDIAIANKETLVTAGHLIMPLVKEYGVQLLPVDSEHSAIFQSLQGQEHSAVSRLLITASGGPFRGKTWEEMESVTLAQALKHPNWSMGKKITIDSATMVNKGLEVIEAHWLFDMDYDHIEAVVHPQSVIHSMVEYKDGSIIGQMGSPDMRGPIQYALYYPRRMEGLGKRLDFAALGQMTFEKPDLKNFPGLAMAYEAGRTGGSMTTVFNAANEWAVAQFIAGKIGFNDIIRNIRRAAEAHTVIADPSLEEILETEKWVYEYLNQK